MPDAESPLVEAFHLLLGEAPAERRDQALRVAIKVLVDSPRTRLGNRSPTVTGADQQRWSELKPRLRQHLATTKTGMSTVARETSLPTSTIQRALSPAGPAPGRAIADLLEKWLCDQTDQNVNANRHEPARTGNGLSHARIGPLPPNRLGPDEAGKLLLYLEVTPERQVRDELQMTAELAHAAATGAEVPPEVVARVHELLAAPE